MLIKLSDLSTKIKLSLNHNSCVINVISTLNMLIKTIIESEITHTKKRVLENWWMDV